MVMMRRGRRRTCRLAIHSGRGLPRALMDQLAIRSVRIFLRELPGLRVLPRAVQSEAGSLDMGAQPVTSVISNLSCNFRLRFVY
jgi:hypothetical protein